MSRQTRRLERIVKGFANHRRIEILRLLASHPDLTLTEIRHVLRIDVRTASEHVRKTVIAGLVAKQSEGRKVRHHLTDGGHAVLKFLQRM